MPRFWQPVMFTVRNLPELEVQIFSGLQADLVKNALAGGSPGTRIVRG